MESPPSNPTEEGICFDTNKKMLRVFEGNAWQDCWWFSSNNLEVYGS
jgi:hypothetical protein